MRYVIVLVAEIEEDGQLAETAQAIRDADIPHLERYIHVAADHVADSILREFKTPRTCEQLAEEEGP